MVDRRASSFQNGLVNGGPATLVYGGLISWLGSLAVCASLAEMVSMRVSRELCWSHADKYNQVPHIWWPVPLGLRTGTRSLCCSVQLGGWYVFSSRPYETALLTYTGWVSIFARLSVCASGAFVVGELIQGLLIFNYGGYEPQHWHSTLLYWTVLLIAMLVNILGIRVFPHIESAAFICHICFFFVLLVPLVYLTPQSTSKYVFTGFENAGGWRSDGISWIVGLLTPAWSYVGRQLQAPKISCYL